MMMHLALAQMHMEEGILRKDPRDVENGSYLSGGKL